MVRLTRLLNRQLTLEPSATSGTCRLAVQNRTRNALPTCLSALVVAASAGNSWGQSPSKSETLHALNELMGMQQCTLYSLKWKERDGQAFSEIQLSGASVQDVEEKSLLFRVPSTWCGNDGTMGALDRCVGGEGFSAAFNPSEVAQPSVVQRQVWDRRKETSVSHWAIHLTCAVEGCSFSWGRREHHIPVCSKVHGERIARAIDHMKNFYRPRGKLAF